MRHFATSAAAVKAQLAEDGFAVVDLLVPTAVEVLRAAQRQHAQPTDPGFDSTILSSDCRLRAAVHEAIRSVIELPLRAMLGDYRIAVCTFARKRAGCADGEVPMHQDWSFVDESRYASFGVWCPLADVDLANGCLQVVRGSHATDHPPRAACSPFLYPGLVTELRERFLTAVPMRAGQAMLFDNRLFHCSPVNRSAADRVAATAVLIPMQARLRYYHAPDRRAPHKVEVFEVEDSFYLSHHAPGRPAQGTRLGIVDILDPASRI
jgi:ectoine hydroxylase-related dioxygenase (phytanoyl-CoA dioxygenase family)